MTARKNGSPMRVVSGAVCVWWGTIAEVAAKPSGLPCCPHCGGVLFEVDSIEDWWTNVDEHEKRGNPHYRKLIEWLRGRHFRAWPQAMAAFDEHLNKLMLEER